jgi:hypothetical protein
MSAVRGRRVRWRAVLAGAGLAAFLVLPGELPVQRALGGEALNTYLPLLTDPATVYYFPLVSNRTSVPVALANGSFEWNTVIGLPNWPNCAYLDPDPEANGDNQAPEGWDFYTPAQGQVMPFPTKMQGGVQVPAISDGPGEYVHRCQWQFPEIEWPGAPRALILDGYWSYKAFGWFIANALRLSQVVTGPPGEYLRVTGYILGETHGLSTNKVNVEDDNFVASMQLGNVADTRFYSTMRLRHDIPGNERAWNRFEVVAQFPASGQLNLTVIVQQNWRDRTDFFLDNFTAERFAIVP